MHTNPDLLALLALGEDVAAEEDLVHIADCSDCRSELDAFRAAAGTARRTNERDVLVAPRPEVWQRISRELHLQPTSADAVTAPPAAAPTGGAAPAATNAGERRRVRAAAFVLAAALALAVGIGLGANLDRVLPGQREVAAVPLNALPRFSGSSGRAVVEQDREGNRFLVVTISSPEPATGPREVWMTNSLGEPMIAMGYLQDNQGRFPIDPSVNLSEFQLIDISQEPAGDQDFRHSGVSIVRGKLPV
nr:anti-sigma factor [uncultured Friedmanniella sp.]